MGSDSSQLVTVHNGKWFKSARYCTQWEVIQVSSLLYTMGSDSSQLVTVHNGKWFKSARYCTQWEVIQVSSLLYTMGSDSSQLVTVGTMPVGSEADTIMKTFALTEVEKHNYDTVLSKFDCYFRPKVNYIEYRVAFQQHTQKHDEPIEQFIRARSLSNLQKGDHVRVKIDGEKSWNTRVRVQQQKTLQGRIPWRQTEGRCWGETGNTCKRCLNVTGRHIVRCIEVPGNWKASRWRDADSADATSSAQRENFRRRHPTRSLAWYIDWRHTTSAFFAYADTSQPSHQWDVACNEAELLGHNNPPSYSRCIMQGAQ